MKHYSKVILSPLVTEKGTLVGETGNQVLFKVAPEANKIEIKQAVEDFFKVKVVRVHTVRLLGKRRRVGRILGQRPSWKKAYVTLAEGQRIDFFEGA
ncbi:MAG: 50S ribosomal protein L23 [Candidatus Binatia bacterium]|nr:50S ribosomal protein L23 [Candidatus Binatia bacterium]